MMKRQFLYKTAIAAVGVIAMFFSGIAISKTTALDSQAIQAPESELANALTELGNLSIRLKAGQEMSERLGLGPQKIAAERAYNAATNLFGHEEYLSTIRELKNYLNLSQVPELDKYLHAQFLLGRSYEEIGYNHRALRAYLRYLSSYLTTKDRDHKQLIEVVQRMIPLSAGGDTKGHQKMNELLSSIAALNIPAKLKPKVNFFVAKAALSTGREKLATSWLDRSIAGNDPTLGAKAIYLKALIALGRQDYVTAEKLLLEINTSSKKLDESVRDMTRLALARIAVKQHKPNLGLKYYSMIDKKSASYRDALYESVYLHLKRDEDGIARTKAMLFLARFPENTQAFQLRTLLAYLDLRAGDLKTAKKGIASTNKQLTGIRDWIGENFVGKDRITHKDLSDLKNMSTMTLEHPEAIEEGYRVFTQMAELMRRLADIRGEIRNVLFTMGRTNIEHLKPFWVNRAEQLGLFANETLRIGHRLAAAERHLYKNKLTPIEIKRLESSEARRIRLLSAPATTKREYMRWTSYAAFIELTGMIAVKFDKLRDAQAELNALRYLMSKENKNLSSAKMAKVKLLSDRTQRLRLALTKSLEILRAQKINDLLKQSPHKVIKKFMSQYAVALADEEEILKKVRDAAVGAPQRLLSDDGTRAWKLWHHNAEEVYTQLELLEGEIRQGLGGILKTLNDNEARYHGLSNKLSTLTNQLEGQMGRAVALIINQYDYRIGNRLSKHQKWSADIDWLSYMNSKQKQAKLQEKLELEHQMLKDNLTDLQQGVLWKWPK